MKIEYDFAEYCFDRGYHFLIPRRDDWNYDAIVPPDVLDVYTGGSKLENGVGSGIYSEKLYLNISLRLLDYCSMFQAEVMAIYRAAQWILANGVSFTLVSIFSNGQDAIRSLSGFVNNSRIVRAGALLPEFASIFSGRNLIQGPLHYPPGPCWVNGVPTNYLILVATSYQP